jgi:hypothetical protein
MLNPPGDGVNGSSEDWYVCEECGAAYNIKDAHTRSEDYFGTCDYASGCSTHCLKCWLGCGPASEALFARRQSR